MGEGVQFVTKGINHKIDAGDVLIVVGDSYDIERFKEDLVNIKLWGEKMVSVIGAGAWGGAIYHAIKQKTKACITSRRKRDIEGFVSIDEALKNISKFGMPNFFGYQRFGRDGDNHIVGEQIAKDRKSVV